MGTARINFEGTLEKTSGIFKNKTKVWMVLQDLSLTYYKNNKRSSCIGSIDMVTVQSVTQKKTMGGGKKFEIITATNTFHFEAETPELCEAWVKVLHQSLTLKSDSTGSECATSQDKDSSSATTEALSAGKQRTSSSTFYDELDSLPTSPTVFGVKLKSTRHSRKSTDSSTDSKVSPSSPTSPGSPGAQAEEPNSMFSFNSIEKRSKFEHAKVQDTHKIPHTDNKHVSEHENVSSAKQDTYTVASTLTMNEVNKVNGAESVDGQVNTSIGHSIVKPTVSSITIDSDQKPICPVKERVSDETGKPDSLRLDKIDKSSHSVTNSTKKNDDAGDSVEIATGKSHTVHAPVLKELRDDSILNGETSSNGNDISSELNSNGLPDLNSDIIFNEDDDDGTGKLTCLNSRSEMPETNSVNVDSGIANMRTKSANEEGKMNIQNFPGGKELYLIKGQDNIGNVDEDTGNQTLNGTQAVTQAKAVRCDNTTSAIHDEMDTQAITDRRLPQQSERPDDSDISEVQMRRASNISCRAKTTSEKIEDIDLSQVEMRKSSRSRSVGSYRSGIVHTETSSVTESRHAELSSNLERLRSLKESLSDNEDITASSNDSGASKTENAVESKDNRNLESFNYLCTNGDVDDAVFSEVEYSTTSEQTPLSLDAYKKLNAFVKQIDKSFDVEFHRICTKFPVAALEEALEI